MEVYLNKPAPAGGLPIAVTSSNPTVLPLPGTITVAAGATNQAVLVKVRWVSVDTPVTVSARGTFNTASGTVTVIPTQLVTVGALQ